MDDQEKDKAPGEQGTAPTDIPGTSTRQRTDSESSGPLQEKRFIINNKIIIIIIIIRYMAL